jgi:hypothetical protein
MSHQKIHILSFADFLSEAVLTDHFLDIQKSPNEGRLMERTDPEKTNITFKNKEMRKKLEQIFSPKEISHIKFQIKQQIRSKMIAMANRLNGAKKDSAVNIYPFLGFKFEFANLESWIHIETVDASGKRYDGEIYWAPVTNDKFRTLIILPERWDEIQIKSQILDHLKRNPWVFEDIEDLDEITIDNIKIEPRNPEINEIIFGLDDDNNVIDKKEVTGEFKGAINRVKREIGIAEGYELETKYGDKIWRKMTIKRILNPEMFFNPKTKKKEIYRVTGEFLQVACIPFDNPSEKILVTFKEKKKFCLNGAWYEVAQNRFRYNVYHQNLILMCYDSTPPAKDETD